MKRQPTQSSYGKSNSYSQGSGSQYQKKAKFEDGPSSFEEELGMMDDELVSHQIIDGEDSQNVSIKQKQKWMRPNCGDWSARERPLIFHWLDIDMVSGQPLHSNPDGSNKMVGSTEGPVPIIRMYGVTQVCKSISSIGLTQTNCPIRKDNQSFAIFMVSLPISTSN